MVIKGAIYKAGKPWGSRKIANISGVTTAIHWTNQPYHWHINDGEEVFVVLAGQVIMHYKLQGEEHAVTLEVGDIYHVKVGEQHYAEPIGEARILVIEKEGSE